MLFRSDFILFDKSSMSAIKRFFSSHKSSSNSKGNNTQNQENPSVNTKPTANDKVEIVNDYEEIKENTSPTMDLPSKSVIEK